MILRTVLMVGFGSATLYLGGGALGLALAIALAHLIAAAPSLATFSQVRWSHSSRAAALHIVSYGWPLLLSFGVTAVGQSIDRLLLAHYLGLATLGSYGVVADVLRQSFTVLGEAIILSLVTVAKTQANRGDADGANQTLQKAFNACLAAATFGAAFFIVFGDAVLRVVLQPDFVAPMQDLIPIFAIAFAFTTMRNFYFAQVIYFTNASYLELIVALLFLGVSTALSVVHGPALRPARRSPGPDGGLHLSPASPSCCWAGAGTACRSISPRSPSCRCSPLCLYSAHMPPPNWSPGGRWSSLSMPRSSRSAAALRSVISGLLNLPSGDVIPESATVP